MAIQKQEANLMRAMLMERGGPELAVQRLMEALDATTHAGHEDYKARIAAATVVLHQVDGKPVERRHEIRETRSGTVPLSELLKSPAAREALMEELAKHPEFSRLMKPDAEV